MREIKFRAWDKEEKIMHQVSSVSFKRGEWWCAYACGNERQYETVIKEAELMQFTGLKDKKGKEIYEGDIVTWGWEKVEVKFGTLLEDEDEGKNRTGWICQDCFIDSECEIVGNIYENPELLKNS